MSSIRQDDSPGLPAAVRAYVLAEADRIERETAWQLAAWRDGWRACEIHHGDAYEAGFADGIMAVKRAQHDAYRLTQTDVARWGRGGREHFADPRPGDFRGRGAA